MPPAALGLAGLPMPSPGAGDEEDDMSVMGFMVPPTPPATGPGKPWPWASPLRKFCPLNMPRDSREGLRRNASEPPRERV